MKHLTDSPEFKAFDALFKHPIKNYILHNYNKITKPEPLYGATFDYNCIRHSTDGLAFYTWEVSFWGGLDSNYFQISKSSQGYGTYGMTGLSSICYRADIHTLDDFKALEKILKIRI